LVTEVEALRAAAVTTIELAKVEGLTLLAKDGLESEEARAFLDAMPTPAALMPGIHVAELEAPKAA
jgi:hypothetical protein